MRPKDFYEKHQISKDNKYVFTLLPSENKEFYEKYIKATIEGITMDDNSTMKCGSYLDIRAGKATMNEIWKGIQLAGTVVADISGFKPNVMYELGVAFMRKDNVLVIMDESSQRKEGLPYNIQDIQVVYYTKDDPEKISNYIRQEIIEKIDGNEGAKIHSLEAQKLFNSAMSLRENDDVYGALNLFENIDQLEQNNWYIHKEWGSLYRIGKEYEEAVKKLNNALQLARSNKNKTTIHIELAKCFIASGGNEDQILLHFENANSLDSNNPDLYNNWAYYYYRKNNYAEAMEKMMVACKLNPNDQNNKNWHKYYFYLFHNPKPKISYNQFVKSHINPKPPTPGPTPGPIKIDSKSAKNAFINLKKSHNPGDVITGIITGVVGHLGVFVEYNQVKGLIHKNNLPKNFDLQGHYKNGDSISVRIVYFRNQTFNLSLELA